MLFRSNNKADKKNQEKEKEKEAKKDKRQKIPVGCEEKKEKLLRSTTVVSEYRRNVVNMLPACSYL